MKVIGLFVIVMGISVLLFVEADNENVRIGNRRKGKGTVSGSASVDVGTGPNGDRPTPGASGSVNLPGSGGGTPGGFKPGKETPGMGNGNMGPTGAGNGNTGVTDKPPQLDSCSDPDLAKEKKDSCVKPYQNCTDGLVCCSGKCFDVQSSDTGSYCLCKKKCKSYSDCPEKRCLDMKTNRHCSGGFCTCYN